MNFRFLAWSVVAFEIKNPWENKFHFGQGCGF